MTLAATYDDPTGTVTLTVSAAPAGTTAVHLERSTDQVRWSDVRGAQGVAVSGGAAVFRDCEYAAGVPNFYRATYSNAGAPADSGATINGRTASAVPASTTIALAPLTVGVGDFVGILVSLSAAPTAGQIGVSTPGWQIVRVGTLGALIYATCPVGGLTDPAVTVTVAGTTALSWYGFRIRNGQLADTTATVNAASTSILFPTAALGSGQYLALLAARAAAFVAPAAPPTTFSNATEGIVAYQTTGGITTGFITFGSGTTSAASFALAVLLDPADMIGQDTVSVTPNQTAIWLKNPLRPFLNRTVKLVGPLDNVGRNSRSGVFDILGRTDPVSVTDLMSGLVTSYTIQTGTRADAVDLDLMIAVGEVLLFQPPGGSNLETIYAVPGSPTRTIFTEYSATRFTTLPLTECAMPDLTLAAVQSTYQTVLNTYATYADLLAAKATYADILLLVGTAEDVITS